MIIILGAPNDDEGNLSHFALSRCDAAFTRFNDDRSLNFICTGGYGDHFNRTEHPHALYCKRYLMSLGVPDDRFLALVESRFTFEDASLSKAILDKYKISSAVLVTSDFHLNRSKFIFDGVIKSVYFQYVGAKTWCSEAEMVKLAAHEASVMGREIVNLNAWMNSTLDLKA
ncbi:YdcF family protein [Shewanella psychrophila]|uniref:YdcF family protein n=1 Tax=Shewanella psychrophila TaxID=225848 RepID=UPI001F40CB59|nr:YdcF family protein [Shewanella psychrophila]